ncbi:MAG: PTS sucrose transporter subunit IIBC [Chloroflexota bacterium]|nr:PTS sucrose transporter subunit IIBC [Chloroflexota bacterium]
MGPALNIGASFGLFLASLFGFVIALPVALFLAFWMSAVRSRWIVVLGALLGALIGFIGVYGWVGTLIYNTILPGADVAPTFFGSLLICSAAGLIGGILLDLIVGRMTSRSYRRREVAHE